MLSRLHLTTWCRRVDSISLSSLFGTILIWWTGGPEDRGFCRFLVLSESARDGALLLAASRGADAARARAESDQSRVCGLTGAACARAVVGGEGAARQA